MREWVCLERPNGCHPGSLEGRVSYGRRTACASFLRRTYNVYTSFLWATYAVRMMLEDLQVFHKAGSTQATHPPLRETLPPSQEFPSLTHSCLHSSTSSPSSSPPRSSPFNHYIFIILVLSSMWSTPLNDRRRLAPRKWVTSNAKSIHTPALSSCLKIHHHYLHWNHHNQHHLQCKHQIVVNKIRILAQR